MITKEKLEQLTVEEIDKEIESRRQLVQQMVGTLYPSILNDEIEQLLSRKAALTSQ